MPSRLYVSLLVVAAIATDSWEHRAWAAPLAEGQGSLAHLEIHAPVGAEVKVEGRNLGKMTAPTRDVEYKSLEAGKEYPIVIEAAFDGKATQRKVVSLMRGQTVRVVFLHPDARRPELVVQTGHSECITSMAFSPDGSQVLTGSQDNSVILWDAASGQQLRTFSIKGPKSVAFSADGQQVLVPGEDATRLWNRVTGEQAEWFNDSFNFAAITPDGRYLGWGGYSQAGVWDLVTAKKLQAIETEKLAKGLSVNCGAWNRRGTLLALGGGDFDKPHTIVVWDPFSKRTVMELPNKFRRLAAVAFSLDDSLIITASGEYREPGQVAIWDAQSGEHLRDFSDVPSQPKSLEFSADGTRLLTVASNAAIIWDFESGKQLVKFARKMDEEYFSVECAAFSPDGKRIATGGNPNQAMIWDSTTGKRLQTLRGRSPKNGAVAVSPDGQFIAVAAGSS
ncbi:MAG TPA: hypothetical protein VFI31_13360, partial [Pirellulales bacterium]|nr:hypothetical protein [Pirellulales bacterium]